MPLPSIVLDTRFPNPNAVINGPGQRRACSAIVRISRSARTDRVIRAHRHENGAFTRRRFERRRIEQQGIHQGHTFGNVLPEWLHKGTPVVRQGQRARTHARGKWLDCANGIFAKFEIPARADSQNVFTMRSDRINRIYRIISGEGKIEDEASGNCSGGHTAPHLGKRRQSCELAP